jgi:hypothetical protein
LNSILVLKDGQIVEQGSHKDLLGLDGIFASMWADQISASDDPAVSLGNEGAKKEASSHSVDLEPTGQPGIGPDPTDSAQQVAGAFETPSASDPSYAAVSDPQDATTVLSASPPALVTFPTSDDMASKRDAAAPTVSFPADLDQPAISSATQDPDGETKRKTMATQNFQRLARRISLRTGKRQGSSSSSSFIPGFGRKESSKDETSSLRGEGSGRDSMDSHGGSEIVEGDKTKSKKEKKDKSKKRKSLV